MAQGKGWYPLPGETVPDSPRDGDRGKRRQISGRRGKRPENRLFPGSKVQPPGGGPSCARARRVLDCFTHTGSFALNAALGGAAHVTAVDVSESAVEMARANAERNGVSDRYGLRGGQCL